MKNPISRLAVCFLFSLAAFAQYRAAVGGGVRNIPAHGPAPVAHPVPAAHQFNDKVGHPDAPQVHSDGKWIGHDTGSNDPH